MKIRACLVLIALSLVALSTCSENTEGPGEYVTLYVEATGLADTVSVDVAPSDANGRAKGIPPFSRRYRVGSKVTITPPARTSDLTQQFWKWENAGKVSPLERAAHVVLSADLRLTAVYADIPTGTLAVRSTPTGIPISFSYPTVPPQVEQGTTPFDLTGVVGTVLLLQAPSSTQAEVFQEWTLDGVTYDQNPATVFTINTQTPEETLRAVYQ
jgi:hypothetical protein